MTSDPNHRNLLASDLDGTLIPAGDATSDGAAFRRRMLAAPHVALAYVTGRHFALALEGIRAAGLPDPSFLAGDVGTTIHVRSGAGWRRDESYRARMQEALGGVRMEDLRTRLEGLGLDLQAPDRQAEFKLSFTFDAHRGEADVEAQVLDRIAGEAVRTVVSRDAEKGEGLLDLLPAGVAKDTAVRHLRDRLGITDDDVLFAGDSGNDRDALLGGWHAVLVGNAADDLRRELAAEAERCGLRHRLLLARASLAAGVLEACEEFGLIRA